jgi:hypothetical protein
MRKKNPIAKAVRLIKPKVIPDKRRKPEKINLDDLHDYADKYRYKTPCQ